MSEAPDLKIVPLPAPTQESAELSEALQACLALAERGDITGFVLVATRRDGSVLRANGRSSSVDAFQLLGVLTHESRWLSELINRENEITDHLGEPA